MRGLVAYQHQCGAPITVATAEALCALPTLNALFLSTFAIESLPSFANLHLVQIHIDARIPSRPLPELLPYTASSPSRAPKKSKSKSSRAQSDKVAEKPRTLADVLSPVLVSSQSTLSVLSVQMIEKGSWFEQVFARVKALSAGTVAFSALRRFLGVPVDDDSAEYKKLSTIAPNLQHLCIVGGRPASLAVPSRPFRHLESL